MTFVMLLIVTTNAHNFEDTLTAFANNIENLIYLLESERSLAIKWFKDNKMIVNLGKFEHIISHKKKKDHAQEIKQIDNKL